MDVEETVNIMSKGYRVPECSGIECQNDRLGGRLIVIWYYCPLVYRVPEWRIY